MRTLKERLLDESTYDNIPQLTDNELKVILAVTKEWLLGKRLEPQHFPFWVDSLDELINEIDSSVQSDKESK